MQRYILKYWFEYGGGMLWANNDAYTNTKFFSCVDPEELPLSQALIAQLYSLEEEFQSSLDWDYPPAPSPWSKEQFKDFFFRARLVLFALREELGAAFVVQDHLEK